MQWQNIQSFIKITVNINPPSVTELLRARFETNEEVKKELSEKIKTQSMPAFLANMTKILDQNGRMYMVGNGVRK